MAWSASGKRNRTFSTGSSGSRWSMVASSRSTPSPVRADTATVALSGWPPSALRTLRPTASRSPPVSVSRSSLLNATTCGVSPAPISASTFTTCAVSSAACGEAASTTCTSSDASMTSSSVARKDFTSVVGRLRMKPTVSLSSAFRLLGSVTARTVGSKVANIFASVSTPAPVSRLNSVDLPALV